MPPSPIRRRTMLAQLDELVDNLKAETDLGHTPRSPPPCTQLTSAPPNAFVTLTHHHDALPASKQVVSQLILELESGGNLRLEVLLWTHPSTHLPITATTQHSYSLIIHTPTTCMQCRLLCRHRITTTSCAYAPVFRTARKMTSGTPRAWTCLSTASMQW